MANGWYRYGNAAYKYRKGKYWRLRKDRKGVPVMKTVPYIPRGFGTHRYANKVFKFTRWADTVDVRYSGGTTTDGHVVAHMGDTHVDGVIYFKLSNVVNPSEFTNLFRWFKINGVRVIFKPVSDVTLRAYNSDSQTEYTVAGADRFTAFDDRDETILNAASIKQLDTCKNHKNNAIIKRFIRPRNTFTIDEDQDAGNSVGIGQMGNPWISTQSNGTRYIGLKFSFEVPTVSVTDMPIYKITCKYYLMFKGLQ